MDKIQSFHLRISIDMWKKIKHMSVDNKKSMNEIINSLLESALNKYKYGLKKQK